MAYKKHDFILFMALLYGALFTTSAQIIPGVYMAKQENTIHELKMTDNYFTYTVYENQPAKFIKTLGGFYRQNDTSMESQLEFNSNVEKDSIKMLTIPYSVDKNTLTWQMDQEIVFKRLAHKKQDLDGPWLFATRGPDEGQDRRGEENPRKTLKFLMDGRFQWIAYHTETFKFSGTGGGTYTAENGVYSEKIEYFSRDNDRVGATLSFDYDVQGNDWHHTGNNSRGEPMYEIWSKRN
jgi:hypothetical protein